MILTTIEDNVPVCPFTGKERKIFHDNTFHVRDFDGLITAIELHFTVKRYDVVNNEDVLCDIDEGIIPTYKVTLKINNETPCKQNGDYCITDGKFDFNHPDYYWTELDFAKYIEKNAPQNMHALLLGGVYRGINYGRFDKPS